MQTFFSLNVLRISAHHMTSCYSSAKFVLVCSVSVRFWRPDLTCLSKGIERKGERRPFFSAFCSVVTVLFQSFPNLKAQICIRSLLLSQVNKIDSLIPSV